MPAKSQAQFRAMQAAAHGKSTLGIPAKVGKDFVSATSNPKDLPARKAKQSNDEFHQGPSKPGRNPPANPKDTNQRSDGKLHSKVRAGLKRAFTPSEPTKKMASSFHPKHAERY